MASRTTVQLKFTVYVPLSGFTGPGGGCGAGSLRTAAHRGPYRDGEAAHEMTEKQRQTHTSTHPEAKHRNGERVRRHGLPRDTQRLDGRTWTIVGWLAKRRSYALYEVSYIYAGILSYMIVLYMWVPMKLNLIEFPFFYCICTRSTCWKPQVFLCDSNQNNNVEKSYSLLVIAVNYIIWETGKCMQVLRN
jgi:hypothetical protein